MLKSRLEKKITKPYSALGSHNSLNRHKKEIKIVRQYSFHFTVGKIFLSILNEQTYIVKHTNAVEYTNQIIIKDREYQNTE